MALLARGGVLRTVCVQSVSTPGSTAAAACHTGAAASDRPGMANRPPLLSLLRRAYAQFFVGLGTISPADAEEIRQRQESRRPGVWYAGTGVDGRGA